MSKGPFEVLHFLIVDDNAYMRQIVETVLRAWGAKKVSHAADGAEALGILQDRMVDIVICDLAMAILDGLEFIRLLRHAKDSPNPYVPIIVMSGHTERRNVISARDAGAHEFLAKPVSAKELYERVMAVIEQPRPFVRTQTYFGPDRRRRLEDFYQGTERRGGVAEAAPDGAPGDPGGFDDGELELLLSDSNQPAAAAGD
jgi:DNA-binding response OmpR family regulator